ncbi:MAG: zf-HC2 domain-containing protein [bacterium]
MLCEDFENRLSDYLEGALEAETHRDFSEHSLRCPVCHELLSEVKSAVSACRVAEVPPPARELEALILQKTMPATAMTCDEFEESLTDYLDGFLPAPFYHRWERHAALCDRCTELPGQVVRSIGACYTYIAEEKPLPAGLNARVLQATLGTLRPQEIRAPLSARWASRLRVWLDPIVSPQLATVATMLLVAVFVLANTVSADGSISGVYQASMRLAEQSYTNGLKELVGGQRQDSSNSAGTTPEQKSQPKSEDRPGDKGQKR